MKRAGSVIAVILAWLGAVASPAAAQGILAQPQLPRQVAPVAFTGQAIEDLIKQTNARGGRPVLPNGTYFITKPIELSKIGPLIIEGETVARLDGWRNGAGVKLVWKGPPDQPMVRMNANSVQWRNVTFDGSGVASHNILIYSTDGWGSSRNTFLDCTFTGARVACVQSGEKSQGNNDTGSFVRCWFSDSRVGFLNGANQSLGHRFDQCDFLALDVALDIPFGGAIVMEQGSIQQCDLLVRTGLMGHNTGPIALRDCRIEAWGKTQKFARLLDAARGDGVQIIFDGLRMSSPMERPDLLDKDATLFKVGPGVSVTIHDSFIKQNAKWPIARVEGASDAEAVIHSQNTTFWGDFNLIDLNEFAKIQLIEPIVNGKRSATLLKQGK